MYLQDAGRIVDGLEEPASYTWIAFSERVARAVVSSGQRYPMVTLNVAKKPGINAVSVARRVHEEMASLQRELLLADFHIDVLRDYGQTANEKVNDLTSSLGFAIVTALVFISVFLGRRAGLVVGLAVPICCGITLALARAFGYTINRVTLFARILFLVLLVEDLITGVDNIARNFAEGRGQRDQGSAGAGAGAQRAVHGGAGAAQANRDTLQAESQSAEQALAVVIGQPTVVSLPALDLDMEGAIEEIVPAAKPGSRRFLVKIRLPYAERLLPGMYALVLVAGGRWPCRSRLRAGSR